MRVLQYLEYRARLKGICGKSVRQQVGWVVDRCALEPKRKNLIRTLSKGYRQRVGLADALLGDPDLLILDEPTNGLDVLTAKVVTDFLSELRASGKTVILSTHILQEVKQMCTRVVIIDHGEIKVDKPISEIENLEQTFREATQY
jgi:ABC-2 type transport system ATP-binding protein